jgi:hypothetical protein
VWTTAWTPDGTRLLIGAEGETFDADDGGIVVVHTSTWDGITALAGERPGRRYPLDVRQWLDRACTEHVKWQAAT